MNSFDYNQEAPANIVNSQTIAPKKTNQRGKNYTSKLEQNHRLHQREHRKKKYIPLDESSEAGRQDPDPIINHQKPFQKITKSQVQEILGPLDPVIVSNTNIEVLGNQAMTGPNILIAKLAKQKFEKWSWMIKTNLFGYCLGFLYHFRIISSEAVYFAIFVTSLIILISLLLQKEKINLRSSHTIAHVFRIANWTSFTLFTFGLALNSIGCHINLYLCTGLGWATIIIESCFGPRDILHQPHTVEIILKYIVWVQLFFINFNLYIDVLSWTICFFNFLSVAFMSAMLALMLLVIFISVVCGSSCYNTRDKSVITGTAWYLLIAILLAIWGIIILNIEDALIPHEQTTTLSTSFILGVSSSLLVTLYTRYFQKKLLLFLFYESVETLENFGGFGEQKPELQFIAHQLPKHQYLARVTSTYFSTLRKSFLLNGRAELSQIHEKICQVKFNHSYPNLNAQSPRRNRFSTPSSIHQRANYSLDDKSKRNCSHTLEDANSCFVCEAAEANTVIMPCGHGGMCYKCATQGWQTTDKCSICRREITNILLVKNIKELGLVKILEKIEKGYPDIENSI